MCGGAGSLAFVPSDVVEVVGQFAVDENGGKAYMYR